MLARDYGIYGIILSLQLKGTYLVIYGRWPTFLFTLGTVSVGVVSSYLAGLHWMLWPLQALMVVVSSVVCLVPACGNTIG